MLGLPPSRVSSGLSGVRATASMIRRTTRVSESAKPAEMCPSVSAPNRANDPYPSSRTDGSASVVAASAACRSPWCPASAARERRSCKPPVSSMPSSVGPHHPSRA